jgi:hypothetical protein
MRLLKPEPIPANDGYAVEIPSGLNYRVIYMYSDKPEYQMFVKNEPNGESMKIFAGMAPKPFEKGDGIIVLDSNDKPVNHLLLRDKSVGGRIAPAGELSPMTMEKQSSKTKDQPLNEQFVRMQKIAGIKINEEMSGNDSSINIGQENVIKQYLNKLRKFEQDNTADMADLKNLETAINMYHKELLNKIR